MMIPLIIVISFLVGLSQGEYTNCYQLDTLTNYKLYWDLSVPGRISFLIQAQSSGWIGLGLSTGPPNPMISNGNMSDIWIGWVDPNSTSSCYQGCVRDYWVSEYGRPSLDPPEDQSVQLISANYSASTGITSVEFYRTLAKPDTYDREINVTGMTGFIWAMNAASTGVPSSDGSTFPKHDPATKGYLELNLSSNSQCVSTPKQRNSFTNPDGTYTVSWETTTTDITLTLTVATTGWVGVGFSNSPTMINADVYVGWIDPTTGKATMTDRYTTAYAMPSTDTSLGGQDNVENVVVGSDVATGVTTITFTRKLDTLDSYDLLLAPGNIYLLWAYGGEGSVDYSAQTFDKHTSKGLVSIDLFSGCVSIPPSTSDHIRIHGLIMVISVTVLLFPGILLARYFKLIFPKWFYVHATLQTLGFLGMIWALILAFYAKSWTFEVQIHTVFGIITFSLVGLEYLLGLTAHFKFDPLRRYPPFFPDKLHWWIGKLAFLIALATISLGMLAYGAHWGAQVLYGVWLLLALVVIFYLQAAIGQTHEPLSPEAAKLSSSSGSVIEYVDDPDDPRKPHSNKLAFFSLLFIVVAAIALLVIQFFISSIYHSVANPGLNGNFHLCLKFDNFTIPNTSSSYVCKGFYLPADKNYHVTAFEAIQDNQLMLYNIIVYETEEFVGEEYFSCDPMPPQSTPIYAWAAGIGTGQFSMPPNVGFPVGKNSVQYLAVQIHYYNPSLSSNSTDSSGIQLYMTSELLPVEAGILTTGVPDNLIAIPPNMSYYEVAGNCIIGGLTDIVTTTNYTIFGSGVHMHSIGTQIFTNHYAVDPTSGVYVKVGVVGCDDYFKFDDQKTVTVNATVSPNDVFSTHCIYNSSKRTGQTLGCESSECEMCFTYLWYYPKIGSPSISNCMGDSQYPIDNNVTEHQCDIPLPNQLLLL